MHYSLGFLGHDICTNFSYDFCSKTFLACIMHFKNQIVLFALSYIFVAFMYFPLSDMCYEIQPKPEVKIESSICTNLFDLTKFVLHMAITFVEIAKPKPENPNPGLGTKPETRV